MRILIGADLVPTQSNEELFVRGDAESLLGQELMDIMQNADYRIFNLEVPLTDKKTPIDKCGPALIAPTATVAGMVGMKVDLLTLANNHILDQGQLGLVSTLKTLEKSGIAYVGVGASPELATKPYVFCCGEKRIGVYACAEHEFSIVQDGIPGANPYDPLESFDHVAALKAVCDYVIVLYHGGKEHYRYPSPVLQKTCRKFAEKGADLVVCQHSHCVGCKETYAGGTIVYGQGNFLFDYNSSDFWNTGLLIQLDEQLQVSYLPLIRCGNGVRLAEGAEKEKILTDFETRSQEIQNTDFVREEYQRFAKSMQQCYMMVLSGINYRSFIFRVLNKLSGGKYLEFFLRRRFRKDRMLTLRNYIECEAHRELMLRSLTDQSH